MYVVKVFLTVSDKRINKYRNYIKIELDIFVIFDNGEHIKVIFDRVQPCPRHNIVAVRRKLIHRLMHVPVKCYR